MHVVGPSEPLLNSSLTRHMARVQRYNDTVTTESPRILNTVIIEDPCTTLVYWNDITWGGFLYNSGQMLFTSQSIASLFIYSAKGAYVPVVLCLNNRNGMENWHQYYSVRKPLAVTYFNLDCYHTMLRYEPHYFHAEVENLEDFQASAFAFCNIWPRHLDSSNSRIFASWNRVKRGFFLLILPEQQCKSCI